jgi:heat shock protein beta
LFTQKEKEVPDEDAEPEVKDENGEKKSVDAEETESDEDEAVVEEVPEDEDKEPPAPKMKKIIVEEWEQLNAQPPIWTR